MENEHNIWNYKRKQLKDQRDELEENTIAMFDENVKFMDSQAETKRTKLCGQFSAKFGKPTPSVLYTIHSLALMILIGNLFFDWFVAKHVTGIAAMYAPCNASYNAALTEPLNGMRNLNNIWKVIGEVFLVFAIFTSVTFCLQFVGTPMQWYFFPKINDMRWQKFIVWVSLFFNDLPQSLLATVIMYTTIDKYPYYLGSTLVGVLSQYLVFYALSNIETFHYPKLLYFHAFLTTVLFVIQVVVLINTPV